MSWNLMLARSNAFAGSDRSIAVSMLTFKEGYIKVSRP